jgi:hypothetical protein
MPEAGRTESGGETADEVGAAEPRERIVGAILAFLKRPIG